MTKPFLKFTAVLALFFTSVVSQAQVALEEMVVTSQKREQNLLDVPVSPPKVKSLCTPSSSW